MRAASVPSAIRVQDPLPLGDVALAPRELTGLSPAELAQAMAESLAESEPDTDAPALDYLRRGFPHVPLTARVAALAGLMRR